MSPPDENEGVHVGKDHVEAAMLKNLAVEVVEKELERRLSTLGIFAKDPEEMQAKMRFLSDLYDRCQTGKKQLFMVVIAIVAAGVIGAMWTAFLTVVRSKTGMILLATLLLASSIAFAQQDHAADHPNYKSWVNKNDRNCCNNEDCGKLAPADERTTAEGGIEVRVLGQWCPIKPHHYLKSGNAPDWSTSHVCVLKPYPGVDVPVCDHLLCYQPRPGT